MSFQPTLGPHQEFDPLHFQLSPELHAGTSGFFLLGWRWRRCFLGGFWGCLWHFFLLSILLTAGQDAQRSQEGTVRSCRATHPLPGQGSTQCLGLLPRTAQGPPPPGDGGLWNLEENLLHFGEQQVSGWASWRRRSGTKRPTHRARSGLQTEATEQSRRGVLPWGSSWVRSLTLGSLGLRPQEAHSTGARRGRANDQHGPLCPRPLTLPSLARARALAPVLGSAPPPLHPPVGQGSIRAWAVCMGCVSQSQPVCSSLGPFFSMPPR